MGHFPLFFTKDDEPLTKGHLQFHRKIEELRSYCTTNYENISKHAYESEEEKQKTPEKKDEEQEQISSKDEKTEDTIQNLYK